MEKIELNGPKLQLVVDPELRSISLRWNGRLVSADTGLMSIVSLSDGQRLYSDKADWKAEKTGEGSLVVTLQWAGFPVTERWVISVDQSFISWSVEARYRSPVTLSCREFGLMLSKDYTGWLNTLESGVFPVAGSAGEKWYDVEFETFTAKAIGVRPDTVCAKEPAAVMDFSATPGYSEPQIRKSDTGLKSLLVLCRAQDNTPVQKPAHRRESVFSCRIGFFESQGSLSGFISNCRSREKGQGQAADLARLRLRAREHYAKGGLLYVLYRGFKYMIHCVRTGGNPLYFLIDNLRISRHAPGPQEFKLVEGDLSVLVNTEKTSVNIYWRDVRLTKYTGVITVSADKLTRRRYSDKAVWKAEQLSPTKLAVELFWPGFLLVQKWELSLEKDGLHWDVWINLKRNAYLAEQEVGMMVPLEYSRWISSYEEGEFPGIVAGGEEWQDMALWNRASKTLGVRPGAGVASRPAVVLDFEGTEPDTEPVIRNSDSKANMRVLLVQINTRAPTPKYRRNQDYHIFSGKIRVIPEQADVDSHIVECKKKLFRERVPFVEDKLPRPQLLNILKPLDVVLVNPPWRKGELWGVRAGSRWPHIKNKGEESYLPFPFFLAYTAALLLRHGAKVRIIDAIAEHMDEAHFIELVRGLEPLLIVSEVSTPSLENDLRILSELSDGGRSRIAVCGLDYNIRQPDFLRKYPFIDFVLQGEYEYTALELYESLKTGSGLSGIKGLIYRRNGLISVNPLRPLIAELDSLPWPLREQLPMEKYLDAPGGIPEPTAQMIASRGCPFGCIFCAWPQLMYNSRSYRVRKPAAVVDEMEYLLKERKFNSVYFDDDTFNIKKDNVLGICREIKERKLRASWAIMARPDTMDEEMLESLRDAGLCAAKYGVESADQGLLDNINKGMDLKKVDRLIRFTKSLGIKIHPTFTFGLPGETPDTIKKTIDYAMSLKPDSIQFSILTPYPGTEFYEQLDKKGQIVSYNWADYDGASKSVIKTDNLAPQDLEKARLAALEAWRRYRRTKRTLVSMPFDRELHLAFANNIKSNGIMRTIAKTCRYIVNL